MGVYCEAEDVRRAAGQSDAFNEDQVIAVGNWIERASAMVDRWTGQWLDSREHLVRTRPVTEGQTSLFLPAPLIELRSLAIDGVPLDTADVIWVQGWLERVDGMPWTCTGRLGIVLTGVFGYDPIPPAIIELTANLAGTLGGLRTRGGFDSTGTFQTVRDTQLPGWAVDSFKARALQPPTGILDGYMVQKFLNQPFSIEAIPEE